MDQNNKNNEKYVTATNRTFKNPLSKKTNELDSNKWYVKP